MKAPSIPILEASAVAKPVPRHDLHLHTDFTDGKSTLDAYVDRAIELGLDAIGFPEHCNLKTTWLSRFVPAIEAARARAAGRVRIHWGIEAKGMNYEGALAATPEMLEAAEYVYGAFHSSLTKTPFPELPLEEAIDMEYRVTIAMIRNRVCHAVAHPGGLSRKYQGSFPHGLFDDIAREAGQHDVALELNPGYGTELGLQIESCVKHGCRVVLGSNAHDVSELGLVTSTLEEQLS